MQLYLLVVLAFALLIAIFSFQNSLTVDIRFLGWQFPKISLVMVILGSVAVGALVAVIPCLMRQVRLRRVLHQYQARNRELAGELAQLKAAALEDTQPLPGVRPERGPF